MALPDDSNPSARPSPGEGSPTHSVRVRRSPRYVRFIVLGGAVGVLLALILTFSFPEQPDFSQAQVFGFLALILVALGVALASAVAIVIDRVSTRRARTIVMATSEHVEPPAELTFLEVGDAAPEAQAPETQKPDPDA